MWHRALTKVQRRINEEASFLFFFFQQMVLERVGIHAQKHKQNHIQKTTSKTNINSLQHRHKIVLN